jgi:hypothetical protein
MIRTSLALAVVASSIAACFSMMGTSDQGITSETHRTHVGGIVFSAAVIPHGAETPAAFVDRCVLGQPCYGRFYLPHSLRDSAHDRYAQVIALRATVDGTAMPDGLFAMTPWWSTYNFTLFRARDDSQPWEHPTWFLRQVAGQLAPGDHEIDLAVFAVPSGGRAAAGAPIATGKLAFTVPADGARVVARALAREDRILATAARQQAAAQAEADRQAADSAAAATASSSSSSSEPSTTEESAVAAPPPPGASCLADGADTDDWNKCCAHHWRMTPDGFSHKCCDTSTYANKGDVRTDCY